MTKNKISKEPSRTAVLVKRQVLNLVPLIGLLVLVGVYVYLGVTMDLRLDKGFETILNTSVVCAVVATGATFIYSLGSFDISLGAATLVSAMIGAMAYNRTENVWVMFLVCIAVAVVIELASSVLAAFLNLPVFITTVAMMSILNAFALVLIQINNTGDSIKVPSAAVKPFDTMAFKLAVLIGYLLIAIFVFNFTKIGRREKFLGGNPVCAKLSGVSMKKMAIVAFVMCGIGIGLGAILTITYAPTISRNTASSVGMNVIMAIVFGGMPVSGGARSKITAAVIGSITISTLDQIMNVLQLGSGLGQVVKAVIFLAVIVLTSLGNRSKTLAR